MSTTPDPERRRELAAIHAAAAKLGMDTADKSPETPYRTILLAQGGKTSAADLSPIGRRRVLAYLLRQQGPLSQAELIEALWSQLGKAGALEDPTPAGLAKFLKARHGVDSPRWLTAIQASQVIEALKAWKARKGGPA